MSAVKKKAGKKTAAKKGTTKKRAPKKSSSKALATMSAVEKELAEYASSESAREKTVGSEKLSIRGKRFTYKEQSLGTELNVIILASVFENSYYDAVFDEDHPTPPACFALSLDQDELAPHESSPDKQNEICDGCPQNEWGTAKKGRGKACSNKRRLVLFNAEDEDFSESEMVTLIIPPTSLRNWKGYVKSLEKRLNRPPFGVVTKLTIDEESDWPVVGFELVEPIDNPEVIQVLISRKAEAEELALVPIDTSGYEPPEETTRKPKGRVREKSSSKVVRQQRTKGGKGARSKFSK